MRRRHFGCIDIRESNKEAIGGAEKESAKINGTPIGGCNQDCCGDAVQDASEPNSMLSSKK